MIGDEKDFGKLVVVDARQLVERVVTNKNMRQAGVEKVRELVRDYCADAEIGPSQIERAVIPEAKEGSDLNV